MENEIVIRQARKEDAERVSDLCEQLSRRVSVSDVIDRLKVIAENTKLRIYCKENHS